MRRLGKSGDRQPPVKIWRIVGENAPYDADKSKQNREHTHEEVVDGAFLMEEIEWWMQREGKERLSEEDNVLWDGFCGLRRSKDIDEEVGSIVVELVF